MEQLIFRKIALCTLISSQTPLGFTTVCSHDLDKHHKDCKAKLLRLCGTLSKIYNKKRRNFIKTWAWIKETPCRTSKKARPRGLNYGNRHVVGEGGIIIQGVPSGKDIIRIIYTRVSKCAASQMSIESARMAGGTSYCIFSQIRNSRAL